jgi:hypothetical protein
MKNSTRQNIERSIAIHDLVCSYKQSVSESERSKIKTLTQGLAEDFGLSLTPLSCTPDYATVIHATKSLCVYMLDAYLGNHNPSLYYVQYLLSTIAMIE